MLAPAFVLASALSPQVPAFAAPVRFAADGATIVVPAPGYASPCWHDFDGDGHGDLVVGAAGSGTFSLYRGDAAGKLTAAGKWQVAGGDLVCGTLAPGAAGVAPTVQFVDVDADGRVDAVCGCWQVEAGLQGGMLLVPRLGTGAFGVPTVLAGADGKPLRPSVAGPAGQPCITQTLGLRPAVADLDGDGRLDLLAGTASGLVAWFRGAGPGQFATTSEWLRATTELLEVPGGSDPCLCDYDRDGDLDLFSGSTAGGVFLFRNVGSATAPRFAMRQWLVEPPRQQAVEWPAKKAADQVFDRPGTDTRVWVADVDGNGTVDLLVGDRYERMVLAPGANAGTARSRVEALDRKLGEVERDRKLDAKAKAEQLDALRADRARIVTTDTGGFVWWYRGK